MNHMNPITIEAATEGRTCSFCGRPQAEVKLLYDGRDALICDGCVRARMDDIARRSDADRPRLTLELLERHFRGLPPEDIATSSRVFPRHMRADLQRALDASCLAGASKVVGIHSQYHHESLRFSALMERGHQPKSIAPLQYEAVDIGEDEPVKCLANALILGEAGGTPTAVLVAQQYDYGEGGGFNVELAVPLGEAGARFTRDFFDGLEQAIRAARSYRGKVLSFEKGSRYSGAAAGITVHKLRAVSREQVVLTQSTLDLIDRNIVEFARMRDGLRELGMSAKKGLLFYGPPGTGKTHTVHYLAASLPHHTTLLITAEQVGLLPEYFRLARLLQPSIMVIEDADLIARDRESMGGGCEEVMLNMLLNEMDGLREEAEIFFILTTNRPESLEAALAARPGRIDQAIEFPLPDAGCRQRLIQLYAGTLKLPPKLCEAIVKRTDGVSASFIKELLRRTAQNALRDGGAEGLAMRHVEAALEEMLFTGGALNVRLLGGAGVDAEAI